MATYALLGNIVFDLLHAPHSFDERRSATFAQHEVLAGKPKLQAMGVDLTEITLQLKLHHQLGEVESRYQALIAAKEKQEALALVLGFSQFKGHFVITELSSQTLFTDEQGNALAREISLSLREFVGDVQQGVLGAAMQMGKNSPLAAFLPKGAVDFVNQAKKLISRGVQVYRQTQQTINHVRTTIALVKADPRNALGIISTALPQLAGNLSGLGEMVGLSHSFATLTQGIRSAGAFIGEFAELHDSLNRVQTAFKQGLKDNARPESWLPLSESAVEAASDIAERMARPAAQLTAWIAVRRDVNEEENA